MTTVYHCSSCGKTHQGIEAVALAVPIPLNWTHRFMCPTNNQQVLLRYTRTDGLMALCRSVVVDEKTRHCADCGTPVPRTQETEEHDAVWCSGCIRPSYQADYTNDYIVSHIADWLQDPTKRGKTIYVPTMSHAHIAVLAALVKKSTPESDWNRIQLVAPGDVIT